MNKASKTDQTPAKGAKNSKTEKLKNLQKSFVCPKCTKQYKGAVTLANHTAKCRGKKPRTNGGARPGAGRKSAKTPEVEIQKSMIEHRKISVYEKKVEMQEVIAAHTPQLLAKQMRMALGHAQLYSRRKVIKNEGTKKEHEAWEVWPVHGQDEYMHYLTLDHDVHTGKAVDQVNEVEYFYNMTNEGDHRALSNLLDRAFGKPKETVEGGEDPELPVTPIEGGTEALAESYFEFMMNQTKAIENTNQ